LIAWLECLGDRAWANTERVDRNRWRRMWTSLRAGSAIQQSTFRWSYEQKTHQLHNSRSNEFVSFNFKTNVCFTKEVVLSVMSMHH